MKIIRIALLGVILYSVACKAHESDKFDGRAWKVGNDASDDTQHVVEYVLPGQTVDQWKELVTHQVMFDPKHKADIPRLLDTMKAQLSAGCPSLSWSVLSQSPTAATYEWSHAICGGYPPQHEISTLSICSDAVCRWAYSTQLVPVPATVRERWLRLLPTLPLEISDSLSDTRSFTLATGETLSHVFKKGIPTPASSKWATVRGAGPTIGPEADGFRLSWVVDLRQKEGSKSLPKISKATLEEVSAKTVLRLFDGPVHDQDGGTMIIAPADMVTRTSYPWLYTDEPTLLIFRVTLTAVDGETDVFLQPVLIGMEVKKQLKSRGYVR